MGRGAKRKGYFKDLETNEILTFMFNPEAISDSQGFNFSSISSPCTEYPVFQYVGTTERTLNFDLLLHGDKNAIQNSLMFFQKIKPQKRFDVPHRLLFAFGNSVKKVVITSIGRELYEYDNNLTVTGATVSLELLELV